MKDETLAALMVILAIVFFVIMVSRDFIIEDINKNKIKSSKLKILRKQKLKKLNKRKRNEKLFKKKKYLYL